MADKAAIKYRVMNTGSIMKKLSITSLVNGVSTLETVFIAPGATRDFYSSTKPDVPSGVKILPTT